MPMASAMLARIDDDKRLAHPGQGAITFERHAMRCAEREAGVTDSGDKWRNEGPGDAGSSTSVQRSCGNVPVRNPAVRGPNWHKPPAANALPLSRRRSARGTIDFCFCVARSEKHTKAFFKIIVTSQCDHVLGKVPQPGRGIGIGTIIGDQKTSERLFSQIVRLDHVLASQWRRQFRRF
jgi:hypothetical protein